MRFRGGKARAEHDESGEWAARPWWARAVCVFTALGPVGAGAAAAIELSRRLPAASTLTVTVLRVLFVVAASTAVVFAVDRFARRLLPLAALYRLSLVFPDRAPSRFRTALKAGSSKRVERLVAETRAGGLPADAGEAARRVVELITAIGDHDRRTRGHSERVRLYADLIGEEMGLSKEEREKLQWAALLHDMGKLSVPGEILNKKGAPTSDEWAILRAHPAFGERLVAPLRPFLGSWADAVGGHHEWWNGTGYPRRLRGDQISQSAAIVAVADAYEVMTAVRSYKKSMPASAARAELTRAAGVQFSPAVVRAFLCVSLGRLRLVAGPVASLAQIPYLGSAVRFPASVGSAIQGASSVAAAAAPSVAASVMVATTAVATSIAVAPRPPAHPAPVQAHAISKLAAAAPPTTVHVSGGSAGKQAAQATSASAAKSGTASSGSSAGDPSAVPGGSASDPASLARSGDANDSASSADSNSDGSETTPPSTDPPVDPVVTPIVSVSIGDDAILEGDSGTRTIAFPVTLSQPSTATVTVHYTVTGLSATAGTTATAHEKSEAGTDLKGRRGTVTFTPGTSGLTAVQKNIAVTIASDTDIEPDETFTVTLSDPSAYAVLARSVATGTILNDDGVAAGITSGIGDVSVGQSDHDSRTMFLTIPVWLSAASTDAVALSYTVSDGTATWSEHANGGGDYGGATSGELDFSPGDTVEKIQIRIWPDANPRPDRMFTITLTSPDGACSLVRATGTVTISDW